MECYFCHKKGQYASECPPKRELFKGKSKGKDGSDKGKRKGGKGKGKGKASEGKNKCQEPSCSASFQGKGQGNYYLASFYIISGITQVAVTEPKASADVALLACPSAALGTGDRGSRLRKIGDDDDSDREEQSEEETEWQMPFGIPGEKCSCKGSCVQTNESRTHGEAWTFSTRRKTQHVAAE